MASKAVKLKTFVNKENETIAFVESDRDFVDTLFSFLTMPMGTIIKLTRNQPPKVGIGAMNNLYGSVENLDAKFFQNEARKTMLLQPRNGSAAHCDSLNLKICEPLRYFRCWSSYCTASKCKLLSYYKNAPCGCGDFLGREMLLLKDKSTIVVSDGPDGGVFINGQPRLIVTDELKVIPASSLATFSLLSKLGVVDASSLEKRTFDIRVNAVLNLLKCSLLSKTPLTETLLRRKPVYEFRKEDFGQDSPAQRLRIGDESKTNGKIWVRLIVSKSKQMVCYAEGSEDFVDLLFGFLTVPLGYIAKEMPGGRTKGSISELYNSVEDLYLQGHLKSKDHKEVLLHPKIAPYFGYKNQLVDLEEAVNPQYYFARNKRQNSSYDILTTDLTLIPFSTYSKPSILTLIDSKSPYEKATNAGGFVAGPAMFTVTDDLIIAPLSPLSGLSILKKLEVPYSDIEQRVVHVSNKEALNLLLSSFTSECALTDTFIGKDTIFPLALPLAK